MLNKVMKKTDHPHIVRIDGVCGGRPIIKGTRLAVWHVADYHYKTGMSVEEILMNCENVTLAQLYDALAYYHDHKAEVDRDIWENSYEAWQERHGTPRWQEAFPEFSDEMMPGVALAGARQKEGITQIRLSEMTGIPRRHISEMERNKRPIDKDKAKLFADALNVGYKIFL